MGIKGNQYHYSYEDRKIWLTFISDHTVKFHYSDTTFYNNPCLLTEHIKASEKLKISVEEQGNDLLISSSRVTVRLDKKLSQFRINYTKDDDVNVLFEMTDLHFEGKEINGNDVKACSTTISRTIDERFYGLGQHQTNTLNYAGEVVEVFHNYKAKGGEVIGIPFLLSSAGYGLINNSLAQTTLDLSQDEAYVWANDCCEDISYIIMFGSNEEIYKELQVVSGTTPMPLKASLGYIQCKQRYQSQEEIMSVAKKYREKKYPLDMLVVDWFYWETLGDMSMNSQDWPDPKAMTEQFADMNIDTMISVWPRFMKESNYYDVLEEKGWFVKDLSGDTVYGTEEDLRGALIDTTNEDCGKWYWDTMYENLGSLGFNAWWTDENEPDLWPYDFQLSAGKGYEVFNLYPYTHVKAIYEGHRKEYKTRCNILSRSAYLGSQKYGTHFWSSDIYPTWGVLEKQIPAAINFCASGMGYWSSDIGGWQALPDYKGRSNFGVEELLIETQGSSSGVVTSKEYGELYTRWFQFSVFCPILRAHGTRDENEVWSYGPDVEAILVKQLHLRYQLMPYIYSMAYKLHTTGMPLLRGLFLTYPNDEVASNIKNQYLFGNQLMVVPITEANIREKKVYLPEGNGWFDFYTNDYYTGGQWINVKVNSETIPVFVKENSIMPLGESVESTKTKQRNIHLKIYGKGPSIFELYEDDGRTYAYESGNYEVIRIEHIAGKLGLTKSNKIFTTEYII